jgi:hypothetical protein
MERKRAGMTGINQLINISFWQGKDIYNLMNVPFNCLWRHTFCSGGIGNSWSVSVSCLQAK